MKRLKTVFPLIAAAIVSAGAFAAEKPRNGFHLWTEDGNGLAESGKVNLLTLNFDPATAALEPPLGTEAVSLSVPDANGKVRATSSQRFAVARTDGSGFYFATQAAATVRSGLFPDPRREEFQCGAAQETRYSTENDFLGCPSPTFPVCQSYPCFDPEGFEEDRYPEAAAFSTGIAVVNGTRYVVFGNQVSGQYSNMRDGEVTIDSYAVTVYSMAGKKLWSKTFPLVDANGYELNPVLSGVGPFNGAADQVRVALASETDAGVLFRYNYYSVANGTLVKSVQTEIASP